MHMYKYGGYGLSMRGWWLGLAAHTHMCMYVPVVKFGGRRDMGLAILRHIPWCTCVLYTGYIYACIYHFMLGIYEYVCVMMYTYVNIWWWVLVRLVLL